MRKLDAREAAAGKQLGRPREELMGKFGLSSEEMERLDATLVVAGFIGPKPNSPDVHKASEKQAAAEAKSESPRQEVRLPLSDTRVLSRLSQGSPSDRNWSLIPSMKSLLLLGFCVFATVFAALLHLDRKTVSMELDGINRELKRISDENSKLKETLDQIQDRGREGDILRRFQGQIQEQKRLIQQEIAAMQKEIHKEHNKFIKEIQDTRNSDLRSIYSYINELGDSNDVLGKRYHSLINRVNRLEDDARSQKPLPHQQSGPKLRSPNSPLR